MYCLTVFVFVSVTFKDFSPADVHSSINKNLMLVDMKLLNRKWDLKLSLTIIEHHTVMLHGRE